MCDLESWYKTVPHIFILDFGIKIIMHRRLSLQSSDSVRKYMLTHIKPEKQESVYLASIHQTFRQYAIFFVYIRCNQPLRVPSLQKMKEEKICKEEGVHSSVSKFYLWYPTALGGLGLTFLWQINFGSSEFTCRYTWNSQVECSWFPKNRSTRKQSVYTQHFIKPNKTGNICIT
jgi:hypothetical protein